MIMASERQIAANRRNARKSTGPRSGGGKNRASRNAYRHGLTLNINSTAAYAKQLDKLVRKIAGESKDAIVLERARAIAQAELDLARVRRAKVALIERASAFGELDPPQLFGTVTQIVGALNAFERGRSMPKPIDASATMPSQEPARLAEAVRRVLPQLRKLDRYERRAAAERERAVLELADRIKL
jgi:predicted component of type VI protein secretion system